jgi:hypothetical protein
MAQKRYIPNRQVCERYGVAPSTLFRWDRNPALGFPAPIDINGRKYRDQDELDAFDAARAKQRSGEGA